MRWPRATRRLLSGSSSDPIPEALIWGAVGLSLIAITYGVEEDRRGFLVNIAASLALVGPGLFITNRVVRNWRHRSLRSVVRATLLHLSVVLRRLKEDVAENAIELQDHVPEVSDNVTTTRTDLQALATLAGSWSRSFEQAAAVRPDKILLPSRPDAITISRAVAQLGDNLARLDMALGLPDVVAEWREAETAARLWEGFRRTPSSSSDVLLVGRDIARSAQVLASQLDDLPPHLT